MISFMINEQTPMSDDTTSRCPSVSSLSTQTSMDSDARSPHIGTITSVSRTGFPKSNTTNRRAPTIHSHEILIVTSRGGTSTRRLPSSGQVLHYPDPAGYYFKIWRDPDPVNLSGFLRLSTIPHSVKRKVGIYFVS